MAAKLIDLRATPTPVATAPVIAPPPPLEVLPPRLPPPTARVGESPGAGGGCGRRLCRSLEEPVVAALLKDPTGFMIGLRVALILAMVLRLLRFVGVGGAKVLAIAALAACAYLGVATGAFTPWLG